MIVEAKSNGVIKDEVAPNPKAAKYALLKLFTLWSAELASKPLLRQVKNPKRIPCMNTARLLKGYRGAVM